VNRHRVRYTIVVATWLNEATLAAFRFPGSPAVTAICRTRRLRVPAGRDLPEVLERLTSHDVQVLEIRRCVEGRTPRVARSAEGAPTAEVSGAVESGGVVVPFIRAVRAGRTPGRIAAAARRAARDASAAASRESRSTGERERPDRPRPLRAVPS
jgi:hypothetical protein